MYTLSAQSAYDILTDKYPREGLIDSIAVDSRLSIKLLSETSILNKNERSMLIEKVKNLDHLMELINISKVSEAERSIIFNKFVKENSVMRYVAYGPNLTIHEQKRILRAVKDAPQSMFMILSSYTSKFTQQQITEIQDMLAGNPNFALQYINKFPKDTGRRGKVIDAISRNGGRALEAFTEFSGFTNEERRKLLTKIAKHKSYLFRLLVQKQYSVKFTDSDKEAMVDTILDTKDFETAKIVHQNLYLGKTLEDKFAPVLVAGKLAGKL